VDRRLLKYIELDYISSDFEAIMLVDASEKKKRRSENLETGDKGDVWPIATRHVT
jgi:hypothetical protein